MCHSLGFMTQTQESEHSKPSNTSILSTPTIHQKNFKCRSPGFAFNSVKRKQVISRYQQMFFSPPSSTKKRKLQLTPEQKRTIERNKKRAVDLQRLNRELDFLQTQMDSNLKYMDDLVSTQDVARCLNLKHEQNTEQVSEAETCVMNNKTDSEYESDVEY